MTHNLDNAKLFPQHHQWVTNENRMNLYSNVEVNVGDQIKLPSGKTVTVTNYPYLEVNEEVRLKTYVNREGKKEKGVFNIIPEYIKTIKGTDIYTRFYKLEVE